MGREKSKTKLQGSSSSDAIPPKQKHQQHQGCSSDAALPPPFRPRRSETAIIIDELGHGGLMLLLFETPSGFAVFIADGFQLYLTNAMEKIWANFVKDYMAQDVIWLKEFRLFKNKANVFNHTSVNSELAEMIRKWHTPGQLLTVGKPEHKTIIEAKLMAAA